MSFCAEKISSTLPNYVEKEDLMSCGQFGLFDAISKFDPTKGFRFETYAVKRIKGAILDDLRMLDWVPRSVRAREKIIENAMDELIRELGRDPSMEELAERAEFSNEEIRSTRGDVVSGKIHNIHMPLDVDSETTVADTITKDVEDLDELFDDVDRERVLEAMDMLGDRERVTLAMHYYLGYTLAEIGQEFGVTESRVCQIHTSALKQIRSGLNADTLI